MALDLWRSGTSDGSFLQRALLVMALAFFPQQTARAADPKPDAIDEFAQKQESLANKARDRLMAAINNCEKQIKNLPLDNDAIELRLQPIRADRIGFELNERLPRAPELQEDTATFVRSYTKILGTVQKRLANLQGKAAKKGPANLIALQSLENRLTKVIDAGDNFKPGTKWQGQRQLPDAVLSVDLFVTQRAGTRFVGELHQSKGGGASGMNVEGQIIGNEIELETVSMIRGDRSYLFMKGVVVKDRIVAAAAEARKGRVDAGSWFALECQQRK